MVKLASWCRAGIATLGAVVPVEPQAQQGTPRAPRLGVVAPQGTVAATHLWPTPPVDVKVATGARGPRTTFTMPPADMTTSTPPTPAQEQESVGPLGACKVDT